MPDSHPHLALFFAVWAAVGPLLGILIGHFLSRSWDKERWLLDCRKEEFRQLLTVLTTEVLAHMNYFAARSAEETACAQDPTRRPDFIRAKKFLDEMDQSHRATSQVILDRLYIAKDLNKLQIRQRFHAVMERARNDRTTDKVVQELNDLISDIHTMALKEWN